MRGFVSLAAGKDLRRYARDWAAMLLWLAIPLLIGGLITFATGGSSGPQPRAHLLVADRDDSWLSGMMIQALSQSGGVIQAEKVAEDDGRARIAEGDGSAFLVIPEGFADAVLHERPMELELLTNPAQRVLPGIVEETLEVLVEGVFYVHRVFGAEIRQMVAGPPEDAAAVAAISTSMHGLIERVRTLVFPPAIQLTIETVATEPEADEPDRGIGFYFLPGIVLMALMFAAQGLSADVWRERAQGTLRRVVTSPQSSFTFLLGKLLAALVVMALQVSIALGLGMAYHGVPWSQFPLAVVWCAISGVGLLVAMTWLQLIASSERAANILTNIVLFPLLMIGGSFFPFEAMPGWMGQAGRYTPNGWSLEHLKAILAEDATLGSMALPILLAVAVAGALLFLCARRMRVFATR